MKKSILLLLFLFPGLCFAEVKDSLLKVLQTNDATIIQSYLDTIPSSQMFDISGYWYNQREVVSGFTETTFLIKERLGPGRYNFYSIAFIFKGNKETLGSYCFGKLNVRAGGSNWKRHFDTITYYTNVRIINEFNNRFINDFGVEVDNTELFEDTIVFGQKCSYAYEDPYWKTYMDSLVALKDREGLMKLIQSANSEKQLYGVWGFSILEKKGKKKGLVLTELERKRIMNVLKKKGYVHSCIGFFFLIETFEDTVKRHKIKFK